MKTKKTTKTKTNKTKTEKTRGMKIRINNSFIAKSIEEELRDMINNGENPQDIPRMHEAIYTDRKDGVIKEYNIRTDRWEVAQDAMETATKAKIEQGNAKSARMKGEKTAKNDGQGVNAKPEKNAETAATAVE